MVNLVDGFIQWTPMESTVGKVMPRVFQDKEYRYLISHGPQRGKRYRGGQAKKLGHRVEKPRAVSNAITNGP